MRNYKPPTWSQSVIDLTGKIIHLQDVLMTGLAACLQGVEIKDYSAFNKDFGAIPFIASLMIEQCDALLELKRGKRGNKPLWFVWAEDVKYFCLNIGRAWPTIRKEARRNDWEYWKIIQCRLEECQRQCLELQTFILKIKPNGTPDKKIYVSQEAAIEWIELTKTLQMGDVTLGSDGFYYRKKY